MGCCFSHTSPYPDADPASSSRAINRPTQQQTAAFAIASSPATNTDNNAPRQQNSQRRRSHHRRPLDQHINRPLKRHVWSNSDLPVPAHGVSPSSPLAGRPWSRTRLDRERLEFFDTCVTGRQEVWQTIHTALEVLWEDDQARGRPCEPYTDSSNGEEEEVGGGGEIRNQDGEDAALVTAQGILNAGELSVPTGNLKDGVYDAWGEFYALPEWVVCDPVDITAPTAAGGETGSSGSQSVDEGDSEGGGEVSVDVAEAGLEKKGKGKGLVVETSTGIVEVVARISETGNDVALTVTRREKVGVLAKRLAEHSGFSHCRVRIVYMGKMLRETKTLEAQGWQEGHIVNAMVFPA